MIAEHISEIQDHLKTLQPLGSCPCRLVLASKTISIEKMMEAYQSGVRDFGENRVQELMEKVPVLPDDIRWHFIGHLQTNKIKFFFHELWRRNRQRPLIHSVDRLDLALALDREAEKNELEKLECLLQVNVTGESSKGGFAMEELESFLADWTGHRLFFKGLMTIGPLTEDRVAIRKAYRSLRQLRDELVVKLPECLGPELSMGMSGDYDMAVEEGATMVRIGSLIFGDRVKK